VLQFTKLLGIFALSAGAALLAWSQAETGQIAGVVTDPAGGVVPQANIRAVNSENGAVRTTTSSGAGDFALTNLLPGNYSVTVEAPGFSTFKQNLSVAVGQK
jgi:carboxypeptidase family protein